MTSPLEITSASSPLSLSASPSSPPGFELRTPPTPSVSWGDLTPRVAGSPQGLTHDYAPDDGVDFSGPSTGAIRSKLYRSSSSFRSLKEMNEKLKFRSALHLTRKASMPVTTLVDLSTGKIVQSGGDCFCQRIPRELQILIMRTLLHSFTETNERWSGEAGGRRELIRLTRVSKTWRALCLDGQLWQDVDMAPYSPFVSTATLSHIINGSFIRSVSFGNAAHVRAAMPNLTNLDLRGYNGSSELLYGLVEDAPSLQSVTLKGVQAVTPQLLEALAQRPLERLDVSRCWSISLDDIASYVNAQRLDYASRLNQIRIAGLKGSGEDFMRLAGVRLTNLSVLDVQGCTGLTDEAIEAYATEQSSLSHLVLSGCAALSIAALRSLTTCLPQLIKLEMASMQQLFLLTRDSDPTLEDLLRSTPLLQQLDLEGTGSYAGVTDRVLDALGELDDLVELKLGYAKRITPEGLIRLIRRAEHLRILEADNTSANNAVMREFMRRRDSPDSSLNLTDCRFVTPIAYNTLASATKPRNGWSGWAATPFGYVSSEVARGKGVLKTFWSWRRVAVPRVWEEMRSASQNGAMELNEQRPVLYKRRRNSWWREQDPLDDRGCVVM